MTRISMKKKTEVIFIRKKNQSLPPNSLGPSLTETHYYHNKKDHVIIGIGTFRYTQKCLFDVEVTLPVRFHAR